VSARDFIAREQGAIVERRATRRPTVHAPQDSDDLFAQKVIETPTRLIRGKVRGTDGLESQRAAVDALLSGPWIREKILQAIATEGPKTDGELENRPEFAHCGQTTVRCRRHDLSDAGKLVIVGRRDKMRLYDLAPAKP